MNGNHWLLTYYTASYCHSSNDFMILNKIMEYDHGLKFFLNFYKQFIYYVHCSIEKCHTHIRDLIRFTLSRQIYDILFRKNRSNGCYDC